MTRWNKDFGFLYLLSNCFPRALTIPRFLFYNRDWETKAVVSIWQSCTFLLISTLERSCKMPFAHSQFTIWVTILKFGQSVVFGKNDNADEDFYMDWWWWWWLWLLLRWAWSWSFSWWSKFRKIHIATTPILVNSVISELGWFGLKSSTSGDGIRLVH